MQRSPFCNGDTPPNHVASDQPLVYLHSGQQVEFQAGRDGGFVRPRWRNQSLGGETLPWWLHSRESQAFGSDSRNRGSNYGGCSNGSLGDYHNNLNGGHRDTFRGRGAGGCRGVPRGSGAVSTTTPTIMDEWVTHPVTQIAGRIRSFASNWKTISSDPWVLSIVSEGFKLEFTSSPFLSAPASNMHMSETQLKICNEEVSGSQELQCLEADCEFESIAQLPSALFAITLRWRVLVTLDIC
ncbi:hypothetical protein OUZ56_032064 [Daphnia magna]|uniref:Uncharacterized protein n=1 Tax=Daphnia magna TaxID=35525 RepID=A0ABQ9ZWU1_9CRUS|nr:hypothetical protein OUZ56_032064 [Daphnia magna]